MTLMSFLLYNVSLFMVNAFTIYDCMLPTFNLLLFGIVSYAYYSIQALHWEIYELKNQSTHINPFDKIIYQKGFPNNRMNLSPIQPSDCYIYITLSLILI
eukprot:UN07953